ncbi:MAG TPA: ATP-binding protein [Phormidium sp.]
MEPITLPGNLDSLRAIADYVMAAATAANLNKKAAYNLRLAVDEIATNIITHGYQATGLSGEFKLQADIDEETLTISIEDTAPLFDPTQIFPPENLNLSLEEREIGGLGVYLAVQGVDRFLYQQVENRNRNIFIVNRKTS